MSTCLPRFVWTSPNEDATIAAVAWDKLEKLTLSLENCDFRNLDYSKYFLTIGWMHSTSRGTHVHPTPIVLCTYCVIVRVTRRPSWFGNLIPCAARHGRLFRKQNVSLQLLCNTLDLPSNSGSRHGELVRDFFFTHVLCRWTSPNAFRISLQVSPNFYCFRLSHIRTPTSRHFTFFTPPSVPLPRWRKRIAWELSDQ